jgi:hypothetical protein
MQFSGERFLRIEAFVRIEESVRIEELLKGGRIFG